MARAPIVRGSWQYPVEIGGRTITVRKLRPGKWTWFVEGESPWSSGREFLKAALAEADARQQLGESAGATAKA